MKYSDNDLDTMWRTVYGEARGTPDDCKSHVAMVIVSRYQDENKRYGPNISAVCLQRAQFSCWNRNDPNYRIIQAVDVRDPVASKCYDICKNVLDGYTPDVTQGSTHYCTLKSEPPWSIGKTPVFTDAAHKFYNNVK